MTLDLLGPLNVRGLGTQRRRTFKVWAAIMVCSTTKALSIWPMEDYSTDRFMAAFTSHCAIYGSPSMVTSDQGSQLRAAAGTMPNWSTVQHKTAPTGTVWRFIPAQAPWRVGLAERMVGLVKNTLKLQINEGEVLNYAQLSAMLLRVADILNRRPLSARAFGYTDFMAITPRDLILGAAPSMSPQELICELEEDMTTERLVRRMQLTERKLEMWWARFFKDVFPLLVPRRKWMLAYRNLSVNDIVLLRYEAKYARDKYRLARVIKLHPDACGGVRTVTIGLRNRAKAIGEDRQDCKSGLQEMLVPVQRLVLILPAAEQEDQHFHQNELVTDTGGERTQHQEAAPEEAPLPPRESWRRTRSAAPPSVLRVQVPQDEEEILDL